MNDADLCCAICIEVFRAPVLILDCGHNFCSECIRSAFERSRECPECRQLQSKQVDELTRNRLVERVIEKMNSVQQNQPPLVMLSSHTEQPKSPKAERNQEYQNTINRLLSVIENKFLDIVILVDGSDSFNQINKDDRFKTTYHRVIRALTDQFLPWIKTQLPSNNTTTIIQFSGVAQLEKHYIPGSFGMTMIDDCQMYQIELPTTVLSAGSNFDNLNNSSVLDGNGQLFLCLQDICQDNFLNIFNQVKLTAFPRKRILITITDDEWDCRRLKDPCGNMASISSISEEVKNLYESFALILSRDEPENADFAYPQNVFHIPPDSFSSKIFETIEIIKMKLSEI